MVTKTIDCSPRIIAEAQMIIIKVSHCSKAITAIVIVSVIMSITPFDTSLELLCSDICTEDAALKASTRLHSFVATSEVSESVGNEVF